MGGRGEGQLLGGHIRWTIYPSVVRIKGTKGSDLSLGRVRWGGRLVFPAWVWQFDAAWWEGSQFRAAGLPSTGGGQSPGHLMVGPFGRTAGQSGVVVATLVAGRWGRGARRVGQGP